MTGDISTQLNKSLSLRCGVDCPLIANSNITCNTVYVKCFTRDVFSPDSFHVFYLHSCKMTNRELHCIYMVEHNHIHKFV